MITHPTTLNEFCIGRMVSKIGLRMIEVAPNVRAATRRLEELTKAWPGDYVVFDQQTGCVVAKTGIGTSGPDGSELL